MVSRLHSEWRRFVKAPAGTRFQQGYRERAPGAASLGWRLLRWAAGLAALAAGTVMLFTPGPGLLAMAFGAALLARESLAVARRCDACELWLREAWSRLRRRGPPDRG